MSRRWRCCGNGVEYRAADGSTTSAHAAREVVVSAGAIGSPHLLARSGIGPAADLAAAGVEVLVDSPHVGRHLKDHTALGLVFPAPGVGIPVLEVGLGLGPDALREWATAGTGLASSSLYDASAWFSTGLSAPHSHDAQVSAFLCGDVPDSWRDFLWIDPDEFFADAATTLSPEAENVLLMANPVQPASEGEVRLGPDPMAPPDIRFNYFDEPLDLQVAVAVTRRTLDIAAHWPGLGPVLVPPALAARHGHTEGAALPDDLLADLVLHYSLTMYHPTSTCRIGDVVDPTLRVIGVGRLRVADASVMPDIVSGNTNAASIMIGEKAAELIAGEHGVNLAEFVG